MTTDPRVLPVLSPGTLIPSPSAMAALLDGSCPPGLEPHCPRVWASPQSAPLHSTSACWAAQNSSCTAAHENISRHSMHSGEQSQLVLLEIGKRSPRTQVTALPQPNISLTHFKVRKNHLESCCGSKALPRHLHFKSFLSKLQKR